MYCNFIPLFSSLEFLKYFPFLRTIFILKFIYQSTTLILALRDVFLTERFFYPPPHSWCPIIIDNNSQTNLMLRRGFGRCEEGALNRLIINNKMWTKKKIALFVTLITWFNSCGKTYFDCWVGSRRIGRRWFQWIQVTGQKDKKKLFWQKKNFYCVNFAYKIKVL